MSWRGAWGPAGGTHRDQRPRPQEGHPGPHDQQRRTLQRRRPPRLAEPPGPDPAETDIAAVAACVRRTLAVASVRVSSRLDLELPGTTDEDRRQARGLRGLVRRGLGTLFSPFLHSSHEGFAEPAAQRYQVAHRAHAELFADSQLYRGPAGRPLTTLTPDPPGDGEDVDHNLLSPLWALAGATQATLDGTEIVHYSLCRRYTVQADLERAAAAGQPGAGDWPVGLAKAPPPPHPPSFAVWTDDRTSGGPLRQAG